MEIRAQSYSPACSPAEKRETEPKSLSVSDVDTSIPAGTGAHNFPAPTSPLQLRSLCKQPCHQSRGATQSLGSSHHGDVSDTVPKTRHKCRRVALTAPRPAIQIRELLPQECLEKHRTDCSENPAVAAQQDGDRTEQVRHVPGLEIRAVQGLGTECHVIDLRQVPMDLLIAPCKTRVAKLRTDLLGKAQNMLSDSIKSRWNLSLAKKEVQELAANAVDIKVFLPAFFSIAQSLEKDLPDHVKEALLAKHRICPNQTFHDNSYCRYGMAGFDESMTDIQIEQIRQQQVFYLPDYTKWLYPSVPKKGRVIRKVLVELLKNAGFNDANPRAFIGFVNPKVADKDASKYLFTAFSGPYDILHGKYSHLIQIFALAKAQLLTLGIFKDVIDGGAWWPCFDMLSYPPQSNRIIVTEYKPELRKSIFFGFTHVLSGASPESIHLMLMERRLSAATCNILDSHNANRQNAFLHAFGISVEQPHYVETLRQLHQSLAILEACIIDSLYHGLSKAGYYNISLNRTAELSDLKIVHWPENIEAARKYLKEGRKLCAVISNTGRQWEFKKPVTTVEELTETLQTHYYCDFQEIISFILYPREEETHPA